MKRNAKIYERFPNFDNLSEKEKSYFINMISGYGVTYVEGKPGIAKSAIMRTIAIKLDLQYMDVRLAQSDETDLRFPFLKDTEYNGKLVKTMSYAVPDWAFKANLKPTLICFEELNRAPLAVRNASLQIMLEREIGSDFSFNDQVYMVATGNLGEDDGTDVEEFDSALNNRLIHMKHDLIADEWLRDFATLTKDYTKPQNGEQQNIIPIICSYLKAKPEEFYKAPAEKDGKRHRAYATPRSWTMLSKTLVANLGWENVNDLEEVKAICQKNAPAYIGTATLAFTRYLEDVQQLSINDVLNDFDRVAKKLKTINRDRKSELVNNLLEKDVMTFTVDQAQNLVKFLHLLEEDEQMAYLTKIVDGKSIEVLKKDPIRTIAKPFKSFLEKILAYS